MLNALKQGLHGLRGRGQARPVSADEALLAKWLQEGYALQQDGMLEVAAERFNAILDADPDNVDANYLLGQVMGRQGDLDSALRYFRSAIAAKPDFADAYTGLGNVQRLRGEAADGRSRLLPRVLTGRRQRGDPSESGHAAGARGGAPTMRSTRCARAPS